MASVTIRNLPEDVRRALKIRAAQNNRSAEAEMRAILESAVRPKVRVQLGTALSQLSRSASLTDADVDVLEANRSQTPATPMRFE